MTLNERIRNLRASNRMTLKEVADKIGVSEGTVQRYESGAITTVPYSSIERIADLYDCDPAYLMGWQPEYKKNDFKPIKNLTEHDSKLITAYHSASEETQNIICRILNIERG